MQTMQAIQKSLDLNERYVQRSKRDKFKVEVGVHQVSLLGPVR